MISSHTTSVNTCYHSVHSARSSKRCDSVGSQKKRRMSLKKAEKIYGKVLEYENYKQNKIKKLQEDLKLKELEDYFS